MTKNWDKALAVSEAVTNVVRHAYVGEEPGRLTGRSGPGPDAVDDEGPGAASGQEVGDRRPDGARTTNQHRPPGNFTPSE